MRRHALAALVLALTGCEASGGSSTADGSVVEPDAAQPRNDPGPGISGSQPITATFVTPAGELVASHVWAQAVGGSPCSPTWELRFATTELGTGPTVTLHVLMPEYAGVEVKGTMRAAASFINPELVHHDTQSATFEATRIDYPANGAPRITGHYLATDPAWVIDLDLDLLGGSAFCPF